jgi:WD40-like Beta Propeller Repeat
MKQYSKWITLLILLLAIISGTINASAQSNDNTPIYFVMNGDIWTYYTTTGQLRQESTWGHNEEPILSPDGTRFAYISMAQIGLNGAFSDPRPTNVWIWKVGDTSEDNAYRLVDQPSNASLRNGILSNVIRRSSLAWSPSGQQLGWIELNSNDQFQLVIYDFATNSQRVLTTDLPPQFGDAGYIGVHNMRWGSGGLAVDNFSASGATDQGWIFEQNITVYDPNSGNIISQTRVGTEREGDMLVDFFWLDNGQVGLVYAGQQKFTLQPTTGALTPVNEFELYSHFAPTKTDRNYFLGKYIGNQLNWDIFWSDGQPQNFLVSNVTDNQVAVSPSGNQIAYVDDALYVWNNGTLTRVAGTDALANSYPKGVIWGAVQWRTSGIISGGDPNCAGAPLPRLVIGQQGAIIAGLGNNILRDKAGKNVDGSKEIGSIPPNGVFTVLAGPQCISAYNWWQVNYNGQVGWTAEGEGSVYWLEPR